MAKAYAIGISDITLLIDNPIGVTQEVDTLTISSGASVSGNISITLNGVATNVAILGTDTSPSDVAAKIRATSFAGWTVSGEGDEAVFTANVGGAVSAPIFGAGSTGADGDFVRTVLGVDNPFETETSIGEVAENSTQFIQEAPTETKFKGDYGDATLMTLFQNGDISLETDIIEVSGEKMAALTGAKWDADTKAVSLPTSAPVIFGQCSLVFDQGFDKIKIHRGQITAYVNGANLKTEMFKLHLKITAVPDASGYVDIVLD